MRVIAARLSGLSAKLQPGAEQPGGQTRADAFTGTDPHVQQRFEPEVLKDQPVGGLPALLASDQVGGDRRFQTDSDKSGDRGGQAIQDDHRPAARRAQDDPGKHSELGAAQSPQRYAPSVVWADSEVAEGEVLVDAIRAGPLTVLIRG